MLGHDDDPEIVDAICVAHDAMPTLLPAAFAVCIEKEESEALAQSIVLEQQRAERQRQQQEAERLEAEADERERIQREIEETERLQASQTPQVNAADITKLMINRMIDLAGTTHLDNDLPESLSRSLRSFFDETSGVDREYLTRAATAFVAQMRTAEVSRIQDAVPDKRAAMSLIQRAGKVIAFLPEAIKQTLLVVRFNSEAPPMRDLPEDEAEFEEEDVQDEGEPQGLPASGTPPGPPPPWNPRETTSTPRTGRVQEAVQRIEAPQISNIPAPKWQDWKTQTGPTIADMEQSFW